MVASRKRVTTRKVSDGGSPIPDVASFTIPDYLDRHAFDHIVHISLRHKYVYFLVPRNASAQVLANLNRLEARHTLAPHPSDPLKWQRRYAMPKETHDRAGSPLFMPSLLPDDLVHEALFGDSFFRFAFLREPLKRAVSTYYYQIWNPTPIRQRFCALVGITDPGGEGFLGDDEFVSLLPKIPRPVLDLQLRPQVEILMARSGVKMDFIGGLHDVNGGLKTVFDRLKLDFEPLAEQPWMLEGSASVPQKAGEFSHSAFAGLKDFLAEDVALYETLGFEGHQ